MGIGFTRGQIGVFSGQNISPLLDDDNFKSFSQNSGQLFRASASIKTLNLSHF